MRSASTKRLSKSKPQWVKIDPCDGKKNSNTVVSSVIKIVIVSLLVGFSLTLFDVTPKQLLASLGGTVESIFQIGVSMFEWAVPYILLGAVVVVPIWIIMKLWAVVRNRG